MMEKYRIIDLTNIPLSEVMVLLEDFVKKQIRFQLEIFPNEAYCFVEMVKVVYNGE